ncbi:hypothetical protein DFH08DRAFT_961968 [Mycena albidolilacea]|uniref:Uncharacterized protein n=1 Tax=Mycena albidolilacea TaxID=1033008 RepID=A0AAD6ZY13_9AGAR|nr:hypothetical protein DFH08DRAFT_961968 [Mycena albidolilacea]
MRAFRILDTGQAPRPLIHRFVLQRTIAAGISRDQGDMFGLNESDSYKYYDGDLGASTRHSCTPSAHTGLPPELLWARAALVVTPHPRALLLSPDVPPRAQVKAGSVTPTFTFFPAARRVSLVVCGATRMHREVGHRVSTCATCQRCCFARASASMCGAIRDSSHVACDAVSAASLGGRRGGIRGPRGRWREDRKALQGGLCTPTDTSRAGRGREERTEPTGDEGVRLWVKTQAQHDCYAPGAIVRLSSDVVDGWVGSASQHIAARPAPQAAAPLLCPPGMRMFRATLSALGFPS